MNLPFQDPVAPDYGCAITVNSLKQVSETPFADGKGAIVMQRSLTGDFNGLAKHMSKDLAAGILKSKRFGNSWLLLGDVRAYADSNSSFQPELQTILADMEHLASIGRTPMLKVYTYDYDDDTVDQPHIDPYTPNYDTGQKYPDRFISVYNNKVTRHASHDDVESSYAPFGSDITTFRLKPGAKVRRFQTGDIWRQACGIHPSAKGLIHWSGTEASDSAKLILTA